MSYDTPGALRRAIEQRLSTQARDSGVSIDRLRRRVVFERIVARLQAGDPGRWVVKGGMALEMRLADAARLTKDLDLGLRDAVDGADELHERLVTLLGDDPHGDRFVVTARRPNQLASDGGGMVTWRVSVEAMLDGREFGRIQLDVSPRVHELTTTEMLPVANSLAFAGLPDTIAEVVDANRHAAEKYHAMQRTFEDRENTRVRDLVDIVLMIEHELLDIARLGEAVTSVWAERDGTTPGPFMPPPAGWRARYEQLAVECDLDARTFDEAVALAQRYWAEATSAGQ